jgi:hypothetical protein
MKANQADFLSKQEECSRESKDSVIDQTMESDNEIVVTKQQ